MTGRKAPDHGRQLLRALRAAQEPKATLTTVASAVQRRLRRPWSMQRYWQIEAGAGRPADDGEKAAIAAVLGVTVDDIAWPVREKVAS